LFARGMCLSGPSYGRLKKQVQVLTKGGT